ncbi:hypothetical protein BaRGS_00004893 [Batillaria attramentaria]|uniref:Uncharacterized protein n=1 Tax=Batillaria attramentaria TaxID=370345 RepID=A0ABD0LW77_9CAEN
MTDILNCCGQVPPTAGTKFCVSLGMTEVPSDVTLADRCTERLTYRGRKSSRVRTLYASHSSENSVKVRVDSTTACVFKTAINIITGCFT